MMIMKSNREQKYLILRVPIDRPKGISPACLPFKSITSVGLMKNEG